MSNTAQGIIFILPTCFFFYPGPNITFSRFDFPQTTVRDMDVIDKVNFIENIKNFLGQTQIPAASCIIVMSDTTCFERDFVNLQIGTQDSLVNTFLDNVPFESVLTRTLPIAEGVKVIAANKEMYDSVKEAFENKGFVIEGAAPASILGVPSASFDANGLSSDFVSLLFSKYNFLKQNGFIINQRIQAPAAVQNTPGEKKPLNKRLIFLSVFFVFLVIILVIVLIFSMQKPAV